jgi:hypothetical protein
MGVTSSPRSGGSAEVQSFSGRVGFARGCGSRENLDVHHLTYKRRGNERPADLVALCRRCHKERHAGKRTIVDVVALMILRRWRIWRYSRGTSLS